MFGTKRKRKEALEKTADQAVQDIKPSAAELRQEERAKKWDEEIASGKDVRDLSAMKPYLGLYDAATNNQVQDRQGTGILNMASRMNPTQAANYKTYMQAKKQQDAAGMLEQAYGQTDADIRGYGLSFAQIANSRNLGKASASQNNLALYYQRNPGAWSKFKDIMGFTIEGGKVAASAAAAGAF